MLDFDCDMLLHLDGIQDDRLGYCSGFLSQSGNYRNISTGCIEMEVLDPKVYLSFKCGAGCEWCLAPPGIQCSGKHVLGLWDFCSVCLCTLCRTLILQSELHLLLA